MVQENISLGAYFMLHNLGHKITELATLKIPYISPTSNIPECTPRCFQDFITHFFLKSITY